MSDIKLFRIRGDGGDELEGRSVAVEKSLQALIERLDRPHLRLLDPSKALARDYLLETGQYAWSEEVGPRATRPPESAYYEARVADREVVQ